MKRKIAKEKRKKERSMSAKFFLYIIVTILVIWSMDAVNINQIFKKNKVNQARMFYLLLGLSMIYLITNFLFDIFTSSKIF